MMLFSIVQNRFLNRYLVRSCVVLFFLLQQLNASNVLAAGLNEEIGPQIPYPHPIIYKDYIKNEIEAIWQIINKSQGELKVLEQGQSQTIEPFRDVVKQIMPIINASSLVTTKSSKLEQLIARIDTVDDLLFYKVKQRQDRVRSISSDNNKSLWQKIIEKIMPRIHRKLRQEYITQQEGLSQIQQLLTTLNNLPSALQFSETLLTQVLLDQNVSVSLRDNDFQLFTIQLNEAIEDIEIFMNDLTSLINPESIAQEQRNDANDTIIYRTLIPRAQTIVNNLESLISIAEIILTEENAVPIVAEPQPLVVEQPVQVLDLVLPGNELLGQENIATKDYSQSSLKSKFIEAEPHYQEIRSIPNESQKLTPIENDEQTEPNPTQPKFNDRELVDSEDESIGCVNKESPVTRDYSQLSLQDELEAADPSYRKKRHTVMHDNAVVDLIAETTPVTKIATVIEMPTITKMASVTETASVIEMPTATKMASVTKTAIVIEMPTVTKMPSVTETASVDDSLIPAGPPPPPVTKKSVATQTDIVTTNTVDTQTDITTEQPVVVHQGTVPVYNKEDEESFGLETLFKEAPIAAEPKTPVYDPPSPVDKQTNTVVTQTNTVSTQTDLETEHTNSEIEHTNLETERTNLETEHTNLETEHTNLETEHTNLETEHTNLETEHTNLETEQISSETEQISSETEDTNSETKQSSSEDKQPDSETAQSTPIVEQPDSVVTPYTQILDEENPPINFDIENNIVRHTTPIEFDYLSLISNALSIRNNILQHNFENVVEAGDNDYYIGKRGWIQFVRSITKQKGSILAFKNNQQGFILGFDVQPIDKLIIGIAYATASSSTKFQSIFNDQQNTTLHVGAIYSKYTLLPNIYLNSYLKYGKAFIQNLGRREGVTVHSKTKGDVTRAKLETYYELKLDKFLFKPIIGIIFDHFLIKNFTEYRKEFNINIPTRKGKRILLETGIGLSKAILVKNISIIPEVHFKLDNTLLLKNSTDIISFTSTAHQIQTIAPIPQSVGFSPKNVMYTLGGYINMQSVLAVELAAGYDYSFRKNFTTHSFYINGLVKF